jgi:pyruvate,water dikinase
VTGTTRIVRAQVDVARVRPGDVVVCANVGSVRAVVEFASGIIAESGGALASPAILAREYGIPAVFAVRGATALIADGQAVTIDGASGIVCL